MCEPTTIMMAASLAISAITTYTQYEDGKNAAEAQEDAIKDAQEKERAATARQYQQIQESAMDQQAQRHTEYLIDDARLKAIGGESGLQGATQDRIEQEAQNNADTDMATLESNRKRQTEQASTQALASKTRADVQLSGIRKPSALGAGLQIAGDAVQAYGKYKTPTPTAAK